MPQLNETTSAHPIFLGALQDLRAIAERVLYGWSEREIQDLADRAMPYAAHASEALCKEFSTALAGALKQARQKKPLGFQKAA